MQSHSVQEARRRHGDTHTHTHTHTHTCTRMHRVYFGLPLQRMHIITAACMPSTHSAQDARRPHGATNIHTFTNILESTRATTMTPTRYYSYMNAI